MPKLQAPLNKLLDEQISELQLQRIWQGAQVPVKQKRKHLPLAAAGLLAAAVIALFLLR